MSQSPVNCAIEVEDVFGPQVSGCYGNFDFTLMFEESILYMLPLLGSTVLVAFRFRQLWHKASVLDGGTLHILKLVSISSRLPVPLRSERLSYNDH
jgi:ATP-binding cassette, subfamily C (CFTR/MRP), member 1